MVGTQINKNCVGIILADWNYLKFHPLSQKYFNIRNTVSGSAINMNISFKLYSER